MGADESEIRLDPDSLGESTPYSVTGHPEVSPGFSLTTGGKLEVVVMDVFLYDGLKLLLPVRV